MSGIVEIRVPTYRRPRWLKRALLSLQAQTSGDWIALVLDDSPEQEGRKVVLETGDERIRYLPNQVRLGCAGNLDQAFATKAYAGAAYACVLEDDNWYLPEFLAANISGIKNSGLSILLRNQHVFREANHESLITPGATTRGGVFTEGVVPVLSLRASLFFCEGISNGGLFWRTSAKSNLQVGRTVKTSPIQEYCRSLMVQETVYFAAEPLAAFSLSPQTSREALAPRSFNRGRQSIWRKLIMAHGRDLVEEARKLARSPEMHDQIEAALCDALAFLHLPVGGWRLKQVAKGIAKMVAVSDPLAELWRTDGHRVLAQ